MTDPTNQPETVETLRARVLTLEERLRELEKVLPVLKEYHEECMCQIGYDAKPHPEKICIICGTYERYLASSSLISSLPHSPDKEGGE